eukprot:1768739-Pyramimonas_sp.AAC.1
MIRIGCTALHCCALRPTVVARFAFPRGRHTALQPDVRTPQLLPRQCVYCTAHIASNIYRLPITGCNT